MGITNTDDDIANNKNVNEPAKDEKRRIQREAAKKHVKETEWILNILSTCIVCRLWLVNCDMSLGVVTLLSTGGMWKTVVYLIFKYGIWLANAICHFYLAIFLKDN